MNLTRNFLYQKVNLRILKEKKRSLSTRQNLMRKEFNNQKMKMTNLKVKQWFRKLEKNMTCKIMLKNFKGCKLKKIICLRNYLSSRRNYKRKMSK